MEPARTQDTLVQGKALGPVGGPGQKSTQGRCGWKTQRGAGGARPPLPSRALACCAECLGGQSQHPPAATGGIEGSVSPDLEGWLSGVAGRSPEGDPEGPPEASSSWTWGRCGLGSCAFLGSAQDAPILQPAVISARCDICGLTDTRVRICHLVPYGAGYHFVPTDVSCKKNYFSYTSIKYQREGPAGGDAREQMRRSPVLFLARAVPLCSAPAGSPERLLGFQICSLRYLLCPWERGGAGEGGRGAPQGAGASPWPSQTELGLQPHSLGGRWGPGGEGGGPQGLAGLGPRALCPPPLYFLLLTLVDKILHAEA